MWEKKNRRDFLLKQLIFECSLKVGEGSQFKLNSTRGTAMNYIFITYYKGQFLGEESRSNYIIDRIILRLYMIVIIRLY